MLPFSSWMFKAMVQNVFSVLPNGHNLYASLLEYVLRLKPRYYDRLHMKSEEFEQKVAQIRRHIENYLLGQAKYESGSSGEGLTKSLENARVLELGTGWYPVVPIGLYLCGAAEIWTLDIVSQCRLDRIKYLLTLFLTYAREDRFSQLLPFVDSHRISTLEELVSSSDQRGEELLKEMNIYMLLGDSRNIQMQSTTIDLFVSNNVLEHIPKQSLVGIFQEFRRLGSEKAVMSHNIDMGDHHSYVDQSITKYNYRRYNKYVWWLFNNSINYQNRLCVSDYEEVHDATRWKIVEKEISKGNYEKLVNKVKISKEFHKYASWEWFVDWCWFVSILDTQEEENR